MSNCSARANPHGSRRPCVATSAEFLEPRLLLASWYVALTGSNTNPGTLAAPFRHIQRAASVAQPGDTVFVRAGTYRETVRPAKSGTETARITFKPYNNESVTISGADLVKSWSVNGGKV